MTTYQDILARLPQLSVEERTRLIRAIADSLLDSGAAPPPKKRSILEFEGVGAELWKDVDSDEYLNQLRDEWDQHP
jgi:hypothetical protein